MDEWIGNLEQTARETAFSGVISIFQGDTTLYNRAFGYRDIKNQLPNTPETTFGMASGTKLFTALGVGALIDLGLITPQTTLGEIDPAYRGYVDPGTTIHHLLTHTAGIYDYYDEEIEGDFDNFSVGIPWCQLETPGDYAPLFKDQAMKFKPRERFSYSNGGYVFLGILIEKLSGRVYRDFIQAHVLQPAGMTRSGFFAFNDLPENTANGYLEDRRTTNIYQLPLRGGGDGGMYTTSEDLRNFWERLFANRILSPVLTRKFLDTHWIFNDLDGYAYGLYKRLDNRMFSILGGDAGVGFDSRYLPEAEITVNILSNLTNGEEHIRRVLLDFIQAGWLS